MLNNKDKLSYLMQIANGFIPLVVISLLSRRSGLEFMGQYFLALSIIGTTQVVVDYGFNLSAVRSFAELLEEQASADDIWSLLFSIISAKLLISVILLTCILTYIAIITPENNQDLLLYVMTGISLSVTNASSLVFALKQCVYLSIAIFFARIIFLLPLFVISPSLWVALALTLMPILVSNIYSFRVSSQCLGRKFYQVKIRTNIASQFVAGRSIFFSSILASLVNSAWPLLLARSLSHTELGAYGVADKILKGLMTLVTPLAPFILAANRASGFISSLKLVLSHRLYRILLLAVPVFSSTFVLLPDAVICRIFGGSVIEYRTLLNLYAVAFILCFINMVSYTYMIKMKHEVTYAPIVLLSFCLSFIIADGFGIYTYMPIIYETLITSIIIILAMVGLTDKFIRTK